MLLHPLARHQQRQRGEHALHRQHQGLQGLGARVFGGLDLFQAVGVGLGVDPGRNAAQGAHGAFLAHGLRDLLQQHPDIGALGTFDRQGVLILRRAALVLDGQDLNGAGFPLHLHALPRQFVERLAVDLDRRVHGRRLHPGPHKAGQHLQQLFFPGSHRGCFQHGTGHIAGIGARTQFEGGAVGLGVVQL